MHDLVRDIDWEIYRVPGKYSPELSPLVYGIFSEDKNVALSASDGLVQELGAAFNIPDNELPFVFVPILIATLTAPDVKHKDVFVGILTELANFCDQSLIKKLKPPPPCPHPRNLRLKAAICLGRETYQRVKDSLTGDYVRESIEYILQVCEQQP